MCHALCSSKGNSCKARVWPGKDWGGECSGTWSMDVYDASGNRADKHLFSNCICICFCISLGIFQGIWSMDVPEWQHTDKYLFPHFVGETVDQYYWQELGTGGSLEGFSSIWNEVMMQVASDQNCSRNCSNIWLTKFKPRGLACSPKSRNVNRKK